MTELEQAKKALREQGVTCALCRGTALRTSRERGVKPLLAFLDSGEDFSGYAAADKVVGKATAFLYVLLGIRVVYAPVISEAALAVLERYGITARYETIVPAIFNHCRDGFCPMETATAHVDTPEAALTAIRQTLERMQKNPL